MFKRLKALLSPPPLPPPRASEPPPPPDPFASFRNAPPKLISAFGVLADDFGLRNTMENGLPVDRKGRPIPWYTYPAIEYLGQFDFENRTVFEFGCGNSSHFWARLGARVWSVDHDAHWHAKMMGEALSGQTFYLGEDRDTYLRAIGKPGRTFDVVVIDGEWRADCVAPAVAHLCPGGFIILDNAERDFEAGSLLREQGFFEIDFNGFGPINDYTWTTAIFLPPGGSRFRMARSPRPVGGHHTNLAVDREGV